MTVYLIADVKVTDDEWVPSYAASVHDIVHKLRSRTTSACCGPSCGRHAHRFGSASPCLNKLLLPLLGAHRLF
jgi:hypothetical protein